MREAELAAFKSASPVLEEPEDAEAASTLWGETVRAAGGHRRENVLIWLMTLLSASAVVWTAAGSLQLVERWANFVGLVKSLVG
jgi:hypothetical protein